MLLKQFTNTGETLHIERLSNKEYFTHHDDSGNIIDVVPADERGAYEKMLHSIIGAHSNWIPCDSIEELSDGSMEIKDHYVNGSEMSAKLSLLACDGDVYETMIEIKSHPGVVIRALPIDDGVRLYFSGYGANYDVQDIIEYLWEALPDLTQYAEEVTDYDMEETEEAD